MSVLIVDNPQKISVQSVNNSGIVAGKPAKNNNLK